MQKSMQHIKRKTDLGKGKVERKLLIQEKLNLKERSVGKECDCTGLKNSGAACRGKTFQSYKETQESLKNYQEK